MKTPADLTVVIPTFNRARYLDRCLAHLVPLAEEFGISIHVSDNASPDDTETVVRSWISRFPQLSYARNEENLGPDRNFEQALRRASTTYVWLLGDSHLLARDCLEHQLTIIANAPDPYDVVIYNVANRVRGLPSQDYTDRNDFLVHLAWHMTCMPALVYNTALLARADFTRYRGTEFMYLGIIFESIGNRDFRVAWVQDHSIDVVKIGAEEKASYWSRRTFDIWIAQWSAFVLSLPPSYRFGSKLACIASHGRESGIFSAKALLALRANEVLTATALENLDIRMRAAATGQQRWLMFGLARTPPSIARWVRSLKRLKHR